jgi:c(7)-type cytochrome triheme protein
MNRAMIVLALAVAVASAGYARVGGGDIVYQVKKIGNVTFRHDLHVEKSGLPCTACHASLYVTKEKRKAATMSQMGKGASCGSCHNGKTAFSVKGSCNQCHTKEVK